LNESHRLAAELPGRLTLGATARLAVDWALQPLGHDDVFWHVRTGEWVAQHRRVPLADFFSFTRDGARWITHEWGFSLLAAAGHAAGGLAGLLALTAVVFLLLGWAVWKRCPASAEGGATASAAALRLGLFAVKTLAFLRPALVGELLFASSLLLLDRYRASRRPALLVALLLVFWAWANVHSGVIFGLFVLGLQTLEDLLPGLAPPAPTGRSARRRWTLAACTVAASVLCLVNPNGLDALRFPFLLNRVFFHSGIAWDLGQFKTYSPGANTALMLLVVLALIGWLRAGREARPRPWEVAAAAAFLAMSWRAGRFVFSLVILLVPVVARLWASPVEDGKPISRRMRWAIAAVAVTAVAAALVVSPVRLPPRLLDRSLPVGAARYLEQHELRGHMFHHANHGGYLHYALNQPIFWDGRNDVFWTLTREVTTTDFTVIEERYDVDILVLTEREYRDLRGEAEGPRWGLVYWDDAAAVYLRRDRFADALGRLEIHDFRGFGGSPAEVKALAADPVTAAGAQAELRGLLAVWPENQRALYFLGVLDYYRGDLTAARNALRAAMALGSNGLLEKTLQTVEQAMPRTR
jgi:hypothetical protein